MATLDKIRPDLLAYLLSEGIKHAKFSIEHNKKEILRLEALMSVKNELLEEVLAKDSTLVPSNNPLRVDSYNCLCDCKTHYCDWCRSVSDKLESATRQLESVIRDRTISRKRKETDTTSPEIKSAEAKSDTKSSDVKSSENVSDKP